MTRRRKPKKMKPTMGWALLDSVYLEPTQIYIGNRNPWGRWRKLSRRIHITEARSKRK